MSIREKTKDRVIFDIDKKKKVLHKSKGVCAHCGKKLTLEDMTVDHVIPLSKGGGNDLKNLVALCEKCNKDKSNYVVQPEEYFNYLDSVYLEGLHKEYKRYYESIDWVSKRQIFSEDRKDVYSSNDFGKVHKLRYFYKADYSDLDDIYYAYIKYHDRKCSNRYSKEDRAWLKEFISFVFNQGCLYVLRNSVGDIAVVVPIFLMLSEDKDGDRTPMCFFSKVLLVYKKVEFSSSLLSFINGLLDRGLKWKEVDSYIGVWISVFYENDLLDDTLYFLHTREYAGLEYCSDEVCCCLRAMISSNIDKVSEVKEEYDKGGLSEEELLARITNSLDSTVDFLRKIGVVVCSEGFSKYFLIRDISVEGLSSDVLRGC